MTAKGKFTTKAFRMTNEQARSFATVARLLGLTVQEAGLQALTDWAKKNKSEALASAKAALDGIE